MAFFKFGNITIPTKLKATISGFKEEVLDSKEDFFNSKKTRNIKNTPITRYNCGGYAFETYSWYQPYKYNWEDRIEDITNLYEDGFTIAEIMEIYLDLDVEIMLQDFQNKIRVIQTEEELRKNETLIAYRLRLKIYDDEDDFFIDHDFHYLVKRGKDWFHKPGSNDFEKINFTEDEWKGGYEGPIIFLAFQSD